MQILEVTQLFTFNVGKYTWWEKPPDLWKCKLEQLQHRLFILHADSTYIQNNAPNSLNPISTLVYAALAVQCIYVN